MLPLPGLAALLIGLSPCAGVLAPIPIGPSVVSLFGSQHKYSPPHLMSLCCTLNLYASSSRLLTPSLFPYRPSAPLVHGLRFAYDRFMPALSASEPCYYYYAVASPDT